MAYLLHTNCSWEPTSPISKESQWTNGTSSHWPKHRNILLCTPHVFPKWKVSDLISQLMVFTVIYVVRINYFNDNISCNCLISLFFKEDTKQINCHYFFLNFYKFFICKWSHFLKDHLFFLKNSKGRRKILHKWGSELDCQWVWPLFLHLWHTVKPCCHGRYKD